MPQSTSQLTWTASTCDGTSIAPPFVGSRSHRHHARSEDAVEVGGIMSRSSVDLTAHAPCRDSGAKNFCEILDVQLHARAHRAIIPRPRDIRGMNENRSRRRAAPQVFHQESELADPFGTQTPGPGRERLVLDQRAARAFGPPGASPEGCARRPGGRCDNLDHETRALRRTGPRARTMMEASTATAAPPRPLQRRAADRHSTTDAGRTESGFHPDRRS